LKQAQKNDRHITAIPEATVAQIHGQIAAVIQVLAADPAERQTLLKMGDKSLAFVEKAHDYAVDNLPSYLDMAAFNADFLDAHGLWNVLTLIKKQLEEAMEDTVMVVGSEAFHTALAFYHNTQAPAKDDIPGAKAIVEDLKTSFPGPGKRRGDAAEPEA
jgi:hypothetical protein